MKIVVDDKIPYIRDAISKITADAVYIKGADIGAADVRDADALIVRTRTRCDEQLLGGSSVRFLATATIGFDHLDTAYLQRAGITWMNCPGCNAGSVEQYLRSVLLLLPLHLQRSTLGIVGCGHVGSRVRAAAEALGMRVLVNDPPLGKPGFVGLDVIEREADVITFHVPLDASTHHLADRAFFGRLQRRPYIINTSRGEVADNDALFEALQNGSVRDAVIDTWENEPDIHRGLLERVMIGTPHIAGYSADGKANADNMVLDGLCRFFGVPSPGLVVPPPLPSTVVNTGNALDLYNPLTDSERLKAAPERFEELRGNYPLRREQFPAPYLKIP
jgi:erythronate-4-phosphate dehydrogenase